MWEEFHLHLLERAKQAMKDNLPIKEIAMYLTWAEYVQSHIDMGGLFEISSENTTF